MATQPRGRAKAETAFDAEQFMAKIREETARGGFLYVDTGTVALLPTHEIEVNTEMKNDEGHVAVRAVLAQQAAPVAAGVIDLASDIPMPPARRAGRRSASGAAYPFEQMEVGQSFFVPQVEGKPKSLSSTISSARKRWGVDTGEVRVMKSGNKVPVYEYERDFEARTWEENGVAGFRVWRTK